MPSTQSTAHLNMYQIFKLRKAAKEHQPQRELTPFERFQMERYNNILQDDFDEFENGFTRREDETRKDDERAELDLIEQQH